jgi:peptidoglycan/LPS O-acetylase OafA/YrhL
VVLYHAGAPGIPGGYAGVDVFFVISGYLIAGILIEDRDRDRYSILKFYDRRIRRIFPALFTMLAVSTALAAITLLPSEMAQFARSLGATVLFSSNIYYWKSAGYFSPAAEDNPLLHTWSLSVEEQFYIVFPLALWAAYRMGLRRVLPVLLAVAAGASLLLAEWGSRATPLAAFYLLPSRSWELLLGAWLAAHRRPFPGGRTGSEAAAFGGLAMIAFAVFAYTRETRFPGLAALLPTVGAAFVIWAGRERETLASKVLSARPLVFVGLISYSLYLWHWPLLVFPRLYLVRPLGPAETALVILASMLVAYASWRFVERPFRSSRPDEQAGARRVVFAGGIAITASLVLTVSLWAGASWRLPAEQARLDSYSAPPLMDECADDDKAVECVSRPSRLTKAVLWGDSHAGQYAEVLEPLADRQGIDLRVVSKPGCPPLVGLVPGVSGAEGEACLKRNEAVLEAILADPEVRAVILAARWARFFFEVKDPEWRGLMGPDGAPVEPAERALAASLHATISSLEARRIAVTLVGQSPEADVPFTRCVAKAAWHDLGMERCKLKKGTLPGGVHSRVVAEVMRLHPKATYIEATAPFCSGGVCQMVAAGRPLLRDADHLSREGAERVLAKFRF